MKCPLRISDGKLGIAKVWACWRLVRRVMDWCCLSLFAVFILAFPGPWQEKGLVHSGWDCGDSRGQPLAGPVLVIMNYYRPEALAFNHDYTWTVLIYGFIFWLWYLWTEWLSQDCETEGHEW